MENTLIINVEFYFGSENSVIAPKKIKPKFRFSLWKDEALTTAGELQELIGIEEIEPGQTSEAKIMIMNGRIAQGLKRGDILSWGAPYQPIGTLRIL
jgi:hypothetical protein